MNSNAHFMVHVQSLWNTREDWVLLKKRQSILSFMDAFTHLTWTLVHGKRYEPDEAELTLYFRCLRRTHKGGRRNPMTARVRRHCINHFYDSINLFYSIRDNGLKRPLDFYQMEDENIYLGEGYRRFVIVRTLGYLLVPVIIHRR